MTRAKRGLVGCLVALALFTGPAIVSAVDVRIDHRAVERVESADEDYLFFGHSLHLSGEAQSLYFVGHDFSLSGEARRNLFAMGGTVTVDGQVHGDALVAGRRVELSGELHRTTLAAAERIRLRPDARVRSGMAVAGDRVTIDGRVDGDLHVLARRLVISGQIDGDVYARSETITLVDGAMIGGGLVYHSRDRLSEQELAAVRGGVEYRDIRAHRYWIDRGLLRVGRWIIIPVLLLSMLVFAMLFYLFPGLRRVDADRGPRRFWTTAAWGLIPVLLYPLIVGTLFLAGIGFGITVPIALSLMSAVGGVAYVMSALTLPQIGTYLSRVFSWGLHEKAGWAVYPKALLGFLPVLVLGLIPYVSVIVFVFVQAIGWGVALEKLFATRLGTSA